MSARIAPAVFGTVVVMSLAACGASAGSMSEQATRTAPSTSSSASSTASAPIDVAAARKALRSPRVPIDRSLFRLDPKYPPSDNLSSSVGVCDGTVTSDGTRLIMHGEFYTSPAPESATVSVIRTMYSSTENRDSALAEYAGRGSARDVLRLAAAEAVAANTAARKVEAFIPVG